MSKLEALEDALNGIRSLGFRGYSPQSEEMYRQFQLRNTFGLAMEMPIHRIFQKDFLEKDISEGFLTLPRASAAIWNDPLENPLSIVREPDVVTGSDIHLGALVSSFHALCWTHRAEPTKSDWANFSHRKEPVRISTTVGKLMDRVMRIDDPGYMHRAWLIGVDYIDISAIQAMQTTAEVYRRMESQGALLALSAAIVRTDYSNEDEVRLLINAGILPPDPLIDVGSELIRIPFKWQGFIDKRTSPPEAFHDNRL